MRYLFDVGHPAEFHYFKHAARDLAGKGHQVLITARDKDVTLDLLRASGMPYLSTGRNLRSKAGKVYSLFRNDVRLVRVVRSFKPDLVVSFLSAFAAHAGWLCGVPVVGFHDTEIEWQGIRMAQPFTKAIVVPECYTRRMPAEKTVRFRGYFELCHLRPGTFAADPRIREALGVDASEKYVLIRFVARNAVHDWGLKSLSPEIKRRAVQEFAAVSRVFISSEDRLPPDLEAFRLDVAPERIHDVMAGAALTFGESATMSAESAVLGTPAVFLDPRGRGYTDDLERRYGLVFNFGTRPEDFERAVAKGLEVLSNANDSNWELRHQKMLSETIDVRAFMLWFIERYPESFRLMKADPDYQDRFRTPPAIG